MATANDITHMHSLGLNSNVSTLESDKLFYYSRGLDAVGKGDIKGSTPILVLVHGYPQTNFMWRHVVPLLPKDIPLFIPDIPGYGRSPPLPGPHNKRQISTFLLSTLSSLLPTSTPTPLILCGHDRGARLLHRLAIDHTTSNSNHPITGLILLDIIPTLHQFHSFSSPLTSVGSFHWSFLANVDLATRMIVAMGGDVFARTCLERWLGAGPGAARFRENEAVEVYAMAFRSESVVRASCEDYGAGAREDVELQEEDQREGKGLDVDTLVMFSEKYLGARFDVRAVWGEWMGKGGLEAVGVGGGCGHFLAEEDPEAVVRGIVGFYEKHAR